MTSEEKRESRISLIQEASPSYFSELFVPNKEKDQLLQEYKNLNGLNGITTKLKINIKTGVDSSNTKDIEDRKRMFGSNDPIVKEPNTLWEYIVECLEDKMLRILLGAAAISTVIGISQEGWKTGWMEGFAIFFAVFVVVTITSLNNYQKEKQFMQLSLENKKKQVLVRRDGVDKNIEIEEVVVGDILKISIGNIIPVDGVMVEGEVQIDESSLTGESDLVKKQTELEINKNKGKQSKVITPVVFSGTSVKQGSGYMLVCAVGVNSHQGKTTLLLQNEGSNELTPLQEKLKILADKIGDFGLISAIVIGFSIFFKESIIRIYNHQVIFNTTIFDTLVNAFIMAVAVIVVAIPEGLPLAVAISLAYSVLKLKDEQNLVRHMDSAETMGGVQHICSDKTGTLTNGVMTLKDVFIEMKKISYKEAANKVDQENLGLLYKAILNNKEATIEKEKNGSYKITGNMTDIALAQALVENKVDLNAFLEYPEGEAIENVNVKTLPFNSEYKMMAKFYKLKDGSFRLFVKGAPERLYDRVLNYLAEDNKISPFSNGVWNKFKETQDEFAEQSMRTLLFLYSQSFTENEFNQITEQSFENWEKHLNNLTIIGMVGIADTKRDRVEESIKTLTYKSGINVKMVTGDNILTAIAIAKDVAILDDKQYKRALLIVKAKEKNKQKINKLNLDIRDLEARIKSSELDRNKVVSLKKELDEKLDEKLLLQRNLYDSEGNLIQDTMIAMEGEEFQRLTGGYKEKKEMGHFKQAEEKSNKDDKNKEFVLANEKNFRKVIQNLKVIARASPEDKYLLVLGLKQIGNVVAVTGDGTNDAPALRVADVGFAMGKRGTDICKEASDIVILNDSFDSIVTAVKYGRNVFDCIRKFLQFQLTSNVVAVLMTFIGGIFLRDAPLNAIQMLWVNLIMDSFASLALATEPPHEDLLYRKPYKRNENMITRMMFYNVMAQSFFQIFVLCIILAYGDEIFGVPSDRKLQHYQWNNTNGYHFTIFFNIFVFMQVFNSINARKLKKSELNIFEDITNNPLYLIVQAIIVAGQVAMVTFGGRPLRTHPLTLQQHFYCAAIAVLCIPFGMCVKMLPFQENVDEDSIEDIPTEAFYKKVIGGRESVKSRSSRISRASIKHSKNV